MKNTVNPILTSPPPATEPMISSPSTSPSLSASLLPGRYSVIRHSAPASLRSAMRGATNLQRNHQPPPQTGTRTDQKRGLPPEIHNATEIALSMPRSTIVQSSLCSRLRRHIRSAG